MIQNMSNPRSASSDIRRCDGGAVSGEHGDGGRQVSEGTLNEFPSAQIEKKFQQDPYRFLIVADKFEEAAEVGRAQVKGGAQVVDVCLANPDRDELRDMDRFMARVTRMVKVPLMIDSTDAAVIESALKACQGKAIVNSINLEDGLERFDRIVPLLKTYGGAVVVGCIDEDKQQANIVVAHGLSPEQLARWRMRMKESRDRHHFRQPRRKESRPALPRISMLSGHTGHFWESPGGGAGLPVPDSMVKAFL